MTLLTGIDPLKYIQEVLVLSIAVIILGLVYVYWNRVVFLLTGDDRIHCSSLDCVWWCCFRCGGLCTGEWTRRISWCPCFPARLRGKNLVRSFGQMIGWATVSVEIKNITVGDLPFDQGRGDFYLSVEASTNPPMVTALQEEKLPKVVHFPEIISLKIRDSSLEKRVAIIVKELNVIGSQDICQIHLSSSSLIDWARDLSPDNRVKRFQMQPCDNSVERETPAWILLEFSEADDVRGVETLGNIDEGGVAVRTWVPMDHQTVAASGAHPAAHHDGAKSGAAMWRQAPRQNVDLQVSPFKHSYALLDDSGNPVAEPSEENLGNLRRLRKLALCIFATYHTLVWVIILGYLFFRFYVWSCYRHFTWDTIALLRGAAFPISSANLHAYVKDCHARFDGTGLSNGAGPTNLLADACRPNSTVIRAVCQNMPIGQPRPEAFTMLVYEMFGTHMDSGVQCYDGICESRDKLAEYDYTVALGGALLMISTFVLKCMMNSCILSLRKSHQKSAAFEQKQRVRPPAGAFPGSTQGRR